MAPRKFHKSKKIVCEVEGREAVEAICVFHRLWSNKWLINVETPNESAPLSVSIIVPAVETYLAMEIEKEVIESILELPFTGRVSRRFNRTRIIELADLTIGKELLMDWDFQEANET